MRRVEIRLLGAPEVVSPVGDRPAFPSGRSLALLAYLAMQPGMAASRAVLAGVLWPGRSDAEARTGLRRTLYELKRALAPIGEDLLQVSRDRIALDTGAVRCDAADPQAGTGTFLNGFDAGVEGFDHWIAEQRSRLESERQARARSEGLTALRRGDFVQALALADARTATDDLDEAAVRIAMRALAGLGRRAEALRRLEALSARLMAELDAAPDDETRTLADHIRRGVAQLPAERFERPSLPSIAVLPFRNLTGEDAHAYLTEAFTSTITAELSRDRSLFVIASDTAAVYATRVVEASEIAQELGIRYLLDGTVRADTRQIRVEVSLTDGLRDAVVWTGRYDRDRGEMLDVQDEITAEVVATLRGYKGVIQRSELRRARSTRAPDLTAYEQLMRGMALKERFLKDDMREARRCFETAIGIDPEMAVAHGWLAWTWFFEVYMGWTDAPEAALGKTFEAAGASVELDPDLDFAHWALGAAHLAAGDCEQALHGFDKALSLNPNCSDALANRAWPLMFLGRSDEALNDLRHAMRLNPYYPDWYLWGLGMVHFVRGETASAERALRAMTVPNDQSTAFLLASAFEAEDEVGSADAGRKLRGISPDFTITGFLAGVPFADPDVPARLRAALSAAGLPD